MASHAFEERQARTIRGRFDGPATVAPAKLSEESRSKSIIQSLCVLVVDDNQYMRKMMRNLLVNCGIKDIYEAGDGITALDTICTVGPDVGSSTGEMPLLSGATSCDRAFARRIPDAQRADHHAQRPRRTLARGRGGAAWRQRVSDQAGVGESALRTGVSITLQPRPTGAVGRLLRPGSRASSPAIRSRMLISPRRSCRPLWSEPLPLTPLLNDETTPVFVGRHNLR